LVTYSGMITCTTHYHYVLVA